MSQRGEIPSLFVYDDQDCYIFIDWTCNYVYLGNKKIVSLDFSIWKEMFFIDGYLHKTPQDLKKEVLLVILGDC